MYNLTAESAYHTPYTGNPLLPYILLSMAGQKHSPETTTDIQDEYDYIVVGAGTAGSVVASRLAEEDCVSVLLLEAGKSPPKITDIPALFTYFFPSELNWSFKTSPQKHAGKGMVERSTTLNAGKAIGGSSIINGLQNIRGHKRDFNKWSEQGAAGWSYEEVLPYFKKLENNVEPKYVANGYHGVGGPVTISTPPYNSELKVAMYKAISEMGYNVTDANGETQTGFYNFQATMKDGQRGSVAKAYLVPNDHRENLDIVAEAYVRKILIEDNKAIGVEFDFGGRTCQVSATREVILSAGTINSPNILMLSGVGPKDELEKHGIPVKADLPVGQNLQEQWGVLSNFELNPRILEFQDKLENNKYIWQYITTKTGPLTSLGGASNLAFLSRFGYPPPVEYPDYELYFVEGIHYGVRQQLTLRDKYHHAIYKADEHKPFYNCLAQILHPKSRGTVTLNSTDPYDPPIVDPNYFSDPDDIEVVVAGMKTCKEFGTSKPLRKIGSKPFSTVVPGCEEYLKDDDAYFRCIAKEIFFTVSHQAGTAKMGAANDTTAVLDPQLRVKNISNLRVVDASVIPTLTSGNFIATIMIGEKASDMIKENIQCDE